MLPTFYINRDIDTERRAFMETALAAAGVNAVRISAVDGYAVPEALKSYYDGGLPAGETGCSASHLLVASMIVASGAPTLVLEDDARFTPDFNETLALAISRLPRDWDILRLCRTSKKPPYVVCKLTKTKRLVRYMRVPTGTAGLLVSPMGARKLLKPRLIREPIDIEIQRSWELGLNIFGIDPPIVTEVDRDILPSTLGVRTTPNTVEHDNITRRAFNLRQIGLANYVQWKARRLISGRP
jgi:glycosyl transferase, family 25